LYFAHQKYVACNKTRVAVDPDTKFRISMPVRACWDSGGTGYGALVRYIFIFQTLRDAFLRLLIGAVGRESVHQRSLLAHRACGVMRVYAPMVVVASHVVRTRISAGDVCV
jgi:hypothetical protein